MSEYDYSVDSTRRRCNGKIEMRLSNQPARLGRCFVIAGSHDNRIKRLSSISRVDAALPRIITIYYDVRSS